MGPAEAIPGLRDNGVPVIRGGKLSSTARRRETVQQRILDVHSLSERRSCSVAGQCRATQQYEHSHVDDEGRLLQRLVGSLRLHPISQVANPKKIKIDNKS